MRTSARIAGGLFAVALAGAGGFASAADAPPDFAPNPAVGWVAGGARYIAPPSGPGPVGPMPGRRQSANNEVRDRGAQALFGMGDDEAPILQPWAAAKLRERNDMVRSGKPAFSRQASCWPIGTPGFLLYPVQPVFFVQTPKEIVLIWQADHQVRHIYMDVPHSNNPKPSWYGESVGHYENGDTLVVDTIGFNDKTYVDNFRTPHTTQLHVVEHFRLVDGGEALEVKVRVEDPGAFTMPWNAAQRYRRDQRKEEVPLHEMVCAENNEDHFNQGLVPIPQADKADF